ncbi:MAG: ABC transporter ATP-binding protein [Acidobacteria bacterium]|nr:ABC transporter ATP-binding protein [Acidobacteriota bacterium]
MSGDRIIFEGVSKFYGEVLGVNRVTLSLAPGITSLVGPNGSGKTTLMNLMTGLITPSDGRIEVLGISPKDPERLFPLLGYCAQWDAFPRSLSGYEFIADYLRLYGLRGEEAHKLAWEALARVELTAAGERKVAGYSKGMRQRLRLAQALAHRPRVLVLDEPLNGLDPMARAETIALFQSLGRQGMHVVISSHILEEVDRISDSVVMMASGYVVAEGNIQQVRREVKDLPAQILVRCSNPNLLASQLFVQDHAVEARLNSDGRGILLRTRDAEGFYNLLNQVAAAGLVDVEAVAPADEDVNSIYQYLIGAGSEGGSE